MPSNTGFLTLADVVDPYAAVKGQQQTMQLGMSLANMSQQDREREQRDRTLDLQGQKIAATADEATRQRAFGEEMQGALKKTGDGQIMAILDVVAKYQPDKAMEMAVNENMVKAAAVRTGRAPDIMRLMMKDEAGRKDVALMVGESEERKAETFTKMNEQYAAIPQLVTKYVAGVEQFQALKKEVGLDTLEQLVKNLKPKDGATLEDEKAYQDATKRLNTVRTGLTQKAQEMMGAFLTPLQQELDKAKTDLALTQEAAQQGVPVNPDVLQAKGDIVHNLEQFATSTIQYMQTGDAAVHDEATSYGRAASNVFDRISTIGQDLTRQKREQAQTEAKKKLEDLRYGHLPVEEASYAKANNLNPLVQEDMAKIRVGARIDTLRMEGEKAALKVGTESQNLIAGTYGYQTASAAPAAIKQSILQEDEQRQARIQGGKTAASAEQTIQAEQNKPLDEHAYLWLDKDGQSAPPDMTKAKAKKQGYLAVSPASYQAVSSARAAKSVLSEFQQLIPRLLVKATGLAPADAAQVGLNRLYGWVKENSGDPDARRLQALSGNLVTFAKAMGDSGNIGLQEQILRASTLAGWKDTQESATEVLAQTERGINSVIRGRGLPSGPDVYNKGGAGTTPLDSLIEQAKPKRKK
mgnify:CR=1 FL=1